MHLKLSVGVLLASLLWTSLATRAAEQVNGIAALVGGSVITFEQVQRAIARVVENDRAKYGDQPELFRQRMLETQRTGIEQLVDRRLILQEAEELKLNIPETIIEDNLQQEIKQRYGDRATLTKTLQEQGVTAETFRREIREQFIEYVMRSRNVPRDIMISPGRIERYYRENEEKFRLEDQVKLRMITIDKTRNPVDALKLGREILAKLDDGAEFADMASVYSDGSQAREGGLYGWKDRKALREDLFDLAFRLPVGKRSDLIDKPEAVYIMLVEEAREHHTRPLTEVRDEIERTLVAAERARLQKQWIERMRKKAFIRYFL